jgi:superfamily II DNA or RNA helicase
MRLLFDHGTLILAEPPERWEFLPGAVWDSRVELLRAPASRYAEIVEALLDRRLPFRDSTRPADAAPPAAWRELPLRHYQRAALLAWELNDARGLVVMPTGSGKTRVAMAAMASARCRALCLVPTRALLEQWCAELRAAYTGPVGCLGDGQRSVEPVTVSTFESAYRLMPTLGNRFDLLVVDEAHHFGGGVRDEALEMCLAPRRLGLTATPPQAGPLARLAQLLGPVTYQIGVGELTGSYLADFELVVLPLSLDRAERERYERDQRLFTEHSRAFRRVVPGGTWNELVSFCTQSAEGRAALAAWRRNRRLLGFTKAKARAVGVLLSKHRSSRVLVFTADNAAAYAIARRHLLMPITCDISRQEREQALAAFRSGELRALVSARVLNEGIDVPDADVAVIVGSTLGEREHVQRVGRLLRPVPGKRALVYELVTPQTSEVWRAVARRRALGAADRLSA